MPFPQTGHPADIALSLWHAVRLTDLALKFDQLNHSPVVEIAWDQEDALPFTLCLSDNEGKPVSKAHGNAVLVDHGYSVVEKLVKGKVSLQLMHKPLTFRGPFDDSLPPIMIGSASSAFNYDVEDVLPDVHLKRSTNSNENEQYLERKNEAEKWYPKQDLLGSTEFDRDFTVEVESDGTAYVRFNEEKSNANLKDQMTITKTMKEIDGKESLNEIFYVTYRIGNGRRGNVGAYKISRITVNLQDPKTQDDKSRELEANLKDANMKNGFKINLYNPMEAKGGIDPEDIDSVSLYAPQSFRTQKRAVTRLIMSTS